VALSWCAISACLLEVGPTPVWASQLLLRCSRKKFLMSAEFANTASGFLRERLLIAVETASGNDSLSQRSRTRTNWLKPAGSSKGRVCAVWHFRLFVFITFRFACLCWPHSFLRRGALLPYTANGAHCSLRGYLLAIGDAGMAGR